MASALDEVLRTLCLVACLAGMPLLFTTHCRSLRRAYVVYLACYVIVTITAQRLGAERSSSIQAVTTASRDR